MINSRFSYHVYPPVFIALALFVLFTVLVPGLIYYGETPVFVFIGLAFFLLIFWWIVFGVLRLLAISVTVMEVDIYTRAFLGLGRRRVYRFDELDGFVTCTVPQRWRTYEYCFVLKDGKRVARLSEKYHYNYAELKQALEEKVPFLGAIPYEGLTELKDQLLP